jgi:hypothetical protein
MVVGDVDHHEVGQHNEGLHQSSEAAALAPILSELISELGSARERAARAETQNEFMREQISSLRSERNLLRGRLIQAHVERDSLPPGLTEEDAELLALEEDQPPVVETSEASVPAPTPPRSAEPPSPAPAPPSSENLFQKAEPPAPPPNAPKREEVWHEPPETSKASPAPADLWERSATTDASAPSESPLSAVPQRSERSDPAPTQQPPAQKKRRWGFRSKQS